MLNVDKSQLENAIREINKLSNEMNEELTELYSLINGVRGVWTTDNSNVVEKVDECCHTVKNLNNNYAEYNNDFVGALRDIISSYELEDSRTSMQISQLDGKTVASMSIAAGAFSQGASGFDFGKMARTASDVTSSKFVSESKVHNSAFGEGEYTFQYREDGTVRIDKNGVPMAFTTKENADKITGGINKTTSSFDGQSSNQDSTKGNSKIPAFPTGTRVDGAQSTSLPSSQESGNVNTGAATGEGDSKIPAFPTGTRVDAAQSTPLSSKQELESTEVIFPDMDDLPDEYKYNPNAYDFKKTIGPSGYENFYGITEDQKDMVDKMRGLGYDDGEIYNLLGF